MVYTFFISGYSPASPAVQAGGLAPPAVKAAAGPTAGGRSLSTGQDRLPLEDEDIAPANADVMGHAYLRVTRHLARAGLAA